MKNPTLDEGSQENDQNTKNDETNEKIDNTQKEIDDIKDIMKNNIEKMIYRGINLTDLKDSCDHLEAQAAQFQVVSRKVRRKMYIRSKKKTIILVSILIIIVLILSIVFFFFYFFFLKSKI